MSSIFSEVPKTVADLPMEQVERVLEGAFKNAGVHISVIPGLHKPILKMLENEDIRIEERTARIPSTVKAFGIEKRIWRWNFEVLSNR